jgi:hypothetical protein
MPEGAGRVDQSVGFIRLTRQRSVPQMA